MRHTDGQNLPLDDPWAINKVWQLLRFRQYCYEKEMNI